MLNNIHKVKELFDFYTKYEFKNELVMQIARYCIKNMKYSLASEALDDYIIYQTEFQGIGKDEVTNKLEGNVIDYNEEVMEYNKMLINEISLVINSSNRDEFIKYFKLWAKLPYKMDNYPRVKDSSKIEQMISNYLK